MKSMAPFGTFPTWRTTLRRTDGLTVLADQLYVTQNFEDVIGVFQLDYDGDTDQVSASKLGELTSPL